MSPKKWILITVVLTSALLVLSACNLPSRERPGGKAVPTDNLLTQAAKTVDAQLTLIALTATATPQLTSTPTVTPAPPTQTPQSATWTAQPVFIPCDRAEFVADINIPDGTKFSPNQNFTKTWRLRNNGSCTWTTAYSLVFDSGEPMGGPASVGLPGSVPPGQYIDLSVNLKSPASAGKFKGNWRLRNASGASFGIGANANVSFWVEIEVAGITPTATATSAPVAVYDLANNYCAATWISGAGNLPCPGTNADAGGFVIRADNSALQNGVVYNGRILETHPQWVDNGVISGRFPPLDIQNGYRFTSTLGCLSGGNACSVIFQLNYRAGGGSLQNLGSWTVSYGDAPKDITVDLSSLAGQSVELVPAVTANGSAGQDWALWVKPLVIK